MYRLSARVLNLITHAADFLPSSPTGYTQTNPIPDHNPQTLAAFRHHYSFLFLLVQENPKLTSKEQDIAKGRLMQAPGRSYWSIRI